MDETPKVTWQEHAIAFKNWLLTKSGKITAGTTIGLLLLTLLIMKACEPAKTTILYPICSAFAEQNIQFPETMRHNLVEEYSSLSLRIYYSHIDGFGQYLTEFVECSFGQNEQRGLFMKAAIYNTINGVTKKVPLKNKGRLYQVEQKHIDLFNQSTTPQIIRDMDPEKLNFNYPEPPEDFTF